LTAQLQVAGLSREEVLAAIEIIGNLDDDGYFRMDLAEIAEECGVSEDIAKRALAELQCFDPSGIASRTLAECILTQLPGVGASPGEIEQIKEIFDQFSAELISYKYEDIERKLGFDRDNLDDLLSLIRRTDPRPGASFSESASYITPDVYIVKDGENYEVAMNEYGLPPLRLNKYYLKVIKQAGIDGGTKDYIEEKLKDALWVLKSLQKRQKAIYKVTKAIIEVQKDYLAKGDEYLKPLRLKDIADKTELHESTVSRVTSGKYAFSPRGLVELKSFFSKGMDSTDGEDISTRRIKSLIRSMVDAEPGDAPYSDEKIAAMLSDDGVKVARRTVAKYREELKIPTMSQRKRMRR
jgi:RNA polymerase sigma-54 factor